MELSSRPWGLGLMDGEDRGEQGGQRATWQERGKGTEKEDLYLEKTQPGDTRGQADGARHGARPSRVDGVEIKAIQSSYSKGDLHHQENKRRNSITEQRPASPSTSLAFPEEECMKLVAIAITKVSVSN